jgi:hypothetical protein
MLEYLKLFLQLVYILRVSLRIIFYITYYYFDLFLIYDWVCVSLYIGIIIESCVSSYYSVNINNIQGSYFSLPFI